jgi:hypothetical protein
MLLGSFLQGNVHCKRFNIGYMSSLVHSASFVGNDMFTVGFCFYCGSVVLNETILFTLPCLEGGQLSSECRARPPEVVVENQDVTRSHYSKRSSRGYILGNYIYSSNLS